MSRKQQNIVFFIFAFFFAISVSSSQLVNVKDGAVFTLRPNVNIKVNGSIAIDDGATLQHSGGASNLRLRGDFINNGSYLHNNAGTVTFVDSLSQMIDGDAPFSFWNLHIDKNDVDDENVIADTSITIANDLRLISNSLLILNNEVDLIIDESARIFPTLSTTRNDYDNVNQESDPLTDQFNSDKHISTSGDTTSGRIVRRYKNFGNQSFTVFITWFPIGTLDSAGTTRLYTPLRIRYLTGESDFNAGAVYGVQAIAREHPGVIVSDVSLRKYWRIAADDIDMNSGGYNIRAYYEDTEVRGNDNNYLLRLFFKNGNPYVNSGDDGTGHTNTGNFFYVEGVNESQFNDPPNTFNGDWTIGQPEAISNTYYSIADGDWNDPATWSRQGYNGAPSAVAPSGFTQNVVFIGDGHIVTLDSVPAVPAQKVIIDSVSIGLDGPGTLQIPAGVWLNSDTLRIRNGGILRIADPDGITQLSSPTQNLGNVRSTELRDYSENGIYVYNGSARQLEGNGLPNIVKELIVENSDTLQLTKNLEIQDGVRIDNGILSLYNSVLDQWFTVNGVNSDTTSREIEMIGNSELIVVEFPEKFKSPTFNEGTVNFAGDGAYSSFIPSSAAAAPGDPVVNQYFNLKISGDRSSNQNITFDNSGEIRVSNNLDMTELVLDPIPNADRFVVSGSKFVFNGDGIIGSPDQDISTVTNAATPVGSSYRLSFNDLYIRGTGTKKLTTVGDTLLIRGDLNIEAATFAADSNNIKILGNWNIDVGTFQADSSSIVFEVDGSTNTVESSGDNFYNITVRRISSNGTLRMLDDMRVESDINIDVANFDLNGFDLAVEGDFTNTGDFLTANTTITFDGAAGDQTFTNSNAASQFHNLAIDKIAGDVIIGAGTANVIVDNQLDLTNGNISGRANDKWVRINQGGVINRTNSHVDGKLRLYFEENANPTTTFQIGNGADYVPLILTISGIGGAAGYVESFTGDDVDPNIANYPFLTQAIMDDELPDAPLLDFDRQVGRHWTLNANFTGSNFVLGAARSYQAEFNFLEADTVTAVVPGMEYNNFEIRQRNGNVNTASWSLTPNNTRDPLKTTLSGNQLFPSNATQYFYIGEPAVPTYYSIADGNWSNPSTWSTAGYGSASPAIDAPGSNAIIRVGDGFEVTLDVNHTLDEFRSVRVEVAGPTDSPGTLNLQDFVISGGANTAFTLDSGATLKIGHEQGITDSGNSGNVRTAARNYSEEANYVYVGDEDPQAVGNGLPNTIANLTVSKDIGTQLDFEDTNPIQVYQIENDFLVESGLANLSRIVLKLRGDFILENEGDFNSGHVTGGGQRLSNGSPAGGQNGTIPNLDNTVALSDTTTLRGGFILNGYSTQEIMWNGKPDTTMLFNRMSLSKNSGEVISRNNIQVAQLYFHPYNRSNLNMRDFNKFVDVTATDNNHNVLRVNFGNIGFNTLQDPIYGYVNGRLIRTLDSRRQYPIGTGTVYHPVDLTPGGTDGRIEVIVTDGNHPLFDSTAINENTNIQKWWEIVIPEGSVFSANNGDFRARLIFDNNNPRGGVNPATDYNQYRYIRATDTWTRVANMSLINRQAGEITYDHNDPGLGGNNIFQDTSQFSARPCITLMVGEPGPGGERLFYSRQTGNWGDPQTWSLDSLGGPPAADFPDNISNDIVTIGKAHEITLDRATPFNTKATTMENIEGAPTLNLPDSTVLRTRQFVQKDGSRLRIGSPDGILTNSTTLGSIRQETGVNIINYNFNNQNNNRFEYIGTEDQSAGNGLPGVVAELVVNNTGSIGDNTVTLADSVRITGDLTIESGRLEYDNTSNIRLDGDLVNNYGADALVSPVNNGIFRFRGAATQQITGSATSLNFPSFVSVQKAGGIIDSDQSLELDNDLIVATNTIIDMPDDTEFRMGADANFIAEVDSFSVNKMIRVSGGPNTATFVKEFTGSGDRWVRFPIGENSGNIVGNPVIYSEAIFGLNNMTYNAGAELELTLRSESPHPDAPPGAEMLRKYWSVETSNITRGSGTSDLKLKYINPEVDGNILDYAPNSFRRSPAGAEGWSFILDNATVAEMDTANKYIVVEGANRLPNQDWSAGIDNTFQEARSYWSIADGNWSSTLSWTNDRANRHNSTISALNTPGFYIGDTVYVNNNHEIDFDNTPLNSIEFLEIGTTGYPTATGGGELIFVTNTDDYKKLVITKDLSFGTQGLMAKSNGSPPSIDTLVIKRDIINDATANNRGMDLWRNATRNIQLFIDGSDSTEISGAGRYNDFGFIRIEKDSPTIKVRNSSTTFSDALTASGNLEMSIPSAHYIHNNSGSATMSHDGFGYFELGVGSTLEIPNGEVIFEDGLIIEQDCNLILNSGADLVIGNDDNEHFQYESNVTFEMTGAGTTMEVAGSFQRRFGTSFIDFTLNDDAEIRVVSEGSDTDPANERGGFDLGESSSIFNLGLNATDNAKIIIERPMNTVSSRKDNDYFNNATVSNVLGGTVQIGDASLPSNTSTEQFTLISVPPYWNLDIANTYNGDMVFSSGVTQVRGDLTIGANSDTDLNGQNVNIGGDFTIDGTFLLGNSGTRRVTMNGNPSATPATSLDQLLSINDNSAGDIFWDFVVSKPSGGRIILNDDVNYPNSNIIIRNTLEFANFNTGIIVADSSDSFDRFVQIGTNSSDLASIQRFGNGHVSGELRRWLLNGVQTRLFPIGTENEYTPATIQTTAGNGTEGLISATAFGKDHPDLDPTVLLDDRNVERYWRVIPDATDAFALGAGRTFRLTLGYVSGFKTDLPPGDVRAMATPGIFELFRRTPELPTARPPAEWFYTDPLTPTGSSATGTNIEGFGDFVIGEPLGDIFYSVASGEWNNPSVWSKDGYGGTPETIDFPGKDGVTTDQARIGDGHKITLSILTAPRPVTRSVTIETGPGAPGYLEVKDEQYVDGLSFEILDDCTIITDDEFGYNDIAGLNSNIGAVRTTLTRDFGRARYVYNRSTVQVVGDGARDVKAFIKNNSSILTFDNISYTVNDSLIGNGGSINLNSSEISLEGDIVINSGASFNPNFSRIRVTNPSADQYTIINNSAASFSFYKLFMEKAAGNLIFGGTNDSLDIFIRDSLFFVTGNNGIINVRNQGNKIVLFDTTDAVRSGSGHVDGTIARLTPTGANSFFYPVGTSAAYTPATITYTGTSGTLGRVDVTANTPVTGLSGRMHPTRKINYFWDVFEDGVFDFGDREANILFRFPSSEVANLSGGVPDNAVMRKYNPNLAEIWQERATILGELTWNAGVANVELSGSADLWTDFGTFYIGEKGPLTFYSVQNGDWTDHNSWTFNSSHTVVTPDDIVPPGEFPNPSDSDIEDVVFVGLDHEISLNKGDIELADLTIRNDSRLDLHNNATADTNTITGSGTFNLIDQGTIAYMSSIMPDGTVLVFPTRNIDAGTTFEFYSNQAAQNLIPAPFGLFNYPNNVLVNSNAFIQANVPIEILGNLSVANGSIFENNAGVNSLQVRGNIINSATIINGGIIEIGTP